MSIAIGNPTTALTDGITVDNGGTNGAIRVIAKDVWTLLDTLTFAADTTKTTVALAAYKDYQIEVLGMVFSTQPMTLGWRMNGSSAAVYSSRWINNVTLTAAAGETSFPISRAILASESMSVRHFVAGLGGAISGTAGGAAVRCEAFKNANDQMILGGNVAIATTQLTDITVFCTGGTVTGVVRIYGKN